MHRLRNVLGGNVGARSPPDVPPVGINVLMRLLPLAAYKPFFILCLRSWLQVPGRRRALCQVRLAGVPANQTSEVIALLSVEIFLLLDVVDLLFQLGDVSGCLALLLFPALSKAVGGGGIALAFLVSHFRRSLHVHRYLNGTLLGVHRHHLIWAVRRGIGHRPVAPVAVCQRMSRARSRIRHPEKSRRWLSDWRHRLHSRWGAAKLTIRRVRGRRAVTPSKA